MDHLPVENCRGILKSKLVTYLQAQFESELQLEELTAISEGMEGAKDDSGFVESMDRVSKSVEEIAIRIYVIRERLRGLDKVEGR